MVCFRGVKKSLLIVEIKFYINHNIFVFMQTDISFCHHVNSKIYSKKQQLPNSSQIKLLRV